ncbi:hypothetical protein [Streptomyces sp. NPDC051662]|uniref:hypothetical protein n=1 Tax=Streptomyces sp. NPDC051662 TaxID=3154750 RepID=UPI003435B29A
MKEFMREVRRSAPCFLSVAGLLITLLDAFEQLEQDGSASLTTRACVLVALGATIQFHRDFKKSEQK